MQKDAEKAAKKAEYKKQKGGPEVDLQINLSLINLKSGISSDKSFMNLRNYNFKTVKIRLYIFFFKVC